MRRLSIYLSVALTALVALQATSCLQKPPGLEAPTIVIDAPNSVYVTNPDLPVTIVPIYTNVDGALYEWKLDGKVIGNGPSLTFSSSETGRYFISITVTTEGGEAYKEVRVDVEPFDEPVIPVPEDTTTIPTTISWCFPDTVFNISTGRKLLLRPLDAKGLAEAKVIWMVDGTERQNSGSLDYLFCETAIGSHDVEIVVEAESLSLSQRLTVNVCPPEGTYYREAAATSEMRCNKVYEYLPAPGQMVNENYTATTMEEACIYAMGRLNDAATLSLGGFGGTLVVGFDHSIVNGGGYDIAITGNSYKGNSEPGAVWVMQDENGNGLPDDTWYELKGSEYGSKSTICDYAVTYRRPEPYSAVTWSDNCGQSGKIDYLKAYHSQPSYYPAWVAAESYTLRGTCLKHRTSDTSGNGTMWVSGEFEWGYADNFSPVDRLADDSAVNHFRISDAVSSTGDAANLKYVDFIKIQTAVNTKAGWLGEISTEVLGVADYHMAR